MTKTNKGSALFGTLIVLSASGIAFSAPVDSNYATAIKLISAGKEAEALPYLDKSIKAFPKKTDLYFTRAGVFQKIGNVSKAIADWNTAIALEPANSSCYHNRAVAYLNSHDSTVYSKAKADFDKSLELKPSDLAYSGRGKLYCRMKNLSAARKDFDAAIKLNPSGAIEAYSCRSALNLQDHKAKEAIADLDRAIKIEPSAPLYNNRAWCDLMLRDQKQSLRDSDLALKLIQKSSRAEPETVGNIFHCRAIAHLQLGETATSLDDCNTAIKASPGSPALLTRSALYARMGKGNEALADANEAFKLLPESAGV